MPQCAQILCLGAEVGTGSPRQQGQVSPSLPPTLPVSLTPQLCPEAGLQAGTLVSALNAISHVRHIISTQKIGEDRVLPRHGLYHKQPTST